MGMDMEKDTGRTRRIELLAPAGSYESMKAAFAAGADAVYIGGSRFGARAYADNLEEDRMCQAIDYAHLHGRRLYMKVNTLFKERELRELYSYLEPYYKRGLDGAIVQDLGAMAFMREHFPGLPLHASTQMTIVGVNGARKLKELGASRIVIQGSVLGGDPPDQESSGHRDRELRPWSAVLLLFRPMPDEQPDRREERQPGTLCPALPPSLRGLAGREKGE